MKTAFTILLLILAVLASGAHNRNTSCPHRADNGNGLAQSYRKLDRFHEGYDEREGFTDHPYLTAVMTVSEQHGRVFSGFITFRSNNTESIDEFSGVVGRDNRTLTIAEHGGGYCTGEVLSANEIELIYMQDGSPYSISIDSFKRV